MLKKFYSCICCQPNSWFPIPYEFKFGGNSFEVNQKTFQSNQVKTTKYNVFNFIPKSILSQYQRLANFYYLIIAIISTIPEATPLNPLLIWLPLLTVLLISILKQLYEDYSRYKTDKMVNQQKQAHVLRRGKLQKIKWKDIIVGDICKIQQEEMVPADILLISSSDVDGLAYIETSTLDGQQTSKIRYAFRELNQYYRQQNISELQGNLQIQSPNPDLSKFRGTLKTVNHTLEIIDNNQLLFRGSKLKNTLWIWGVVVYTGQCSKIMMNGQSFVTKLSGVQRKLNYMLIIILIIQIIVCIVIASISANIEMPMRQSQKYIIWRTTSKSRLFVMDFLLFFIEYSSCIPVSLIVSIEIAKTVQSYFIDFDKLMYSAWRKRQAFARTAGLNEQLGQIQYVFCDKTGTLTKNQLKFHTAVIGNQFYEFNYNQQNKKYNSDKFQSTLVRQYKNRPLQKSIILLSDHHIQEINDYSTLINEYMMGLLVCNTISTIQNEQDKIIYESQSPDQLAMVQMARDFGYKFLKRDKDTILVQIDNKIHKIQVITRFMFTSDRKRMSIIIRWNNMYILYAKGADNIIMERSNLTPFNINSSLNSLAKNGLRSLLVAMRFLNDKDVQQFKIDLNHASFSQRQKVIQQYANKFENDLVILGATGLLDQLQTQVPQVIKDLQRAQIRVWMLTGDKLQTAVEIGKSCGLIQSQYQAAVLRSNDIPIQEFILDNQAKAIQSTKKFCLIVEGSALAEIFNNQYLQQKFAEMTLYFASVICCRMLPSQKSQAVRMIKHHLKKTCLAIGDGGNDVSMIKQANIGVGLYGQQGMNAVQASDYAIPQFRMLWRLLFVHGRWNYIRISEMILYFTYKSLIFTIPRILFSFKNSFSGKPIYDDYFIALYNVLFTALPLLVRALFEQDVNYVVKAKSRQQSLLILQQPIGQTKYLPQGYKIHEGMRKLFPKLYFVGIKNEIFNVRQCLLWTIQSILMGISIFFIIQKSLSSLSITIDGFNSNLQLASITIYTAVIMLDTVKLSMQVRHWTKLLFFTIIFLSIGPYLAFIWVLNYKFKRPVQGVLIVYFTTIKTYLSILILIMILVILNSLMVYIKFHSQIILKKLSIALQSDCQMISYISQKRESQLRQKIDSDGLIKIKSNQIMNQAHKIQQ